MRFCLRNRPAIVIVLSTLAILATSPAAAQPKMRTRVRPGNAEGPPPMRSRADAHCPMRSRVLAEEMNRLDSYKGEVSGIDSEIIELERRLKELRDLKSRLSAQVQMQQKRTESAQSSYDASCAGGADSQCQEYESLATGLQRQSQAIDDELKAAKSDLDLSSRQVSSLKTQIEPLQREYKDKRCNDMVPGETSQQTIDRCSAIFSDWNRLQSDLNAINAKVPGLRHLLARLLMQLERVDSHATRYADYLRQNCKGSNKIGELTSRTRRERATGLTQELDRLAAEVLSLRGVKITVSTP